MVVDMGLPAVLLVGLLVWGVSVGEARVVVVVSVVRREMNPFLLRPEVMGHMHVLVIVDLLVMVVLFARHLYLLPALAT